MNKRNWITIVLSPTLPTDLIEDLITDSYDLVVAALPVGLRSALETPAGDEREWRPAAAVETPIPGGCAGEAFRRTLCQRGRPADALCFVGDHRDSSTHCDGKSVRVCE
jgi:hypothetical protein